MRVGEKKNNMIVYFFDELYGDVNAMWMQILRYFFAPGWQLFANFTEFQVFAVIY